MNKGHVIAFVLGALSVALISTLMPSDSQLISKEQPSNSSDHRLSEPLESSFNNIKEPLTETLSTQHKSIQHSLTALTKSELVAEVERLENELTHATQKHEQLIKEVSEHAETMLRDKVAELEQQMQQQLELLLSDGVDTLNLATKFEQQTRDDHWAETTEAVFQDFFTTHDFIEFVQLKTIDCRESICQINYQYADDFESIHLFQHKLSEFVTKHKFATSQSQEANGSVNMHIAK
ncbi:hypothetical protein [Pseudoalteromonas sp. T1lg24]|uniref:hypothetical protein n=1 Tax=Pseudoalteromonas sp. T1lg24 TaxID=2077099 RepID=UPI000CF6A3B1|nr:hypothetical protein [Pseudoalteromonas sp. T1lg24]